MYVSYPLSLGECPTYEVWLEKKETPTAVERDLDISCRIIRMSSIAAAKRRRAGGESTPPLPPPQQMQTQNEAPKMTIQQAFGIIDTRLTILEKATKPEATNSTANLEYMEEMDQKFMMLAEEITTMKDIVLKLQSFTMEVNQKMSRSLETSTSFVENQSNISISTSIADEIVGTESS